MGKAKKSQLSLALLTLLLCCSLLLLSTFVFAQQTFTIEKKPVRDAAIVEFPALPLQYDLTLTNRLATDDYYKMFSLLDVVLSPISLIHFNAMEEKTIPLVIYLKKKLPSGKYAYTYYIKNSYEIYEDRFVFSVVKASDAFSIEVPSSITRFDNEIKIKIKNNMNFAIENLSLSSNSPLIASSQTFSLGPLEEKEIKLVLSSSVRDERAGVKKIGFVLAYEGPDAKKEENSYVLEKEIMLEEHKDIATEKKEGLIFIGKKVEIKKTNKGNAPVDAVAEVELNAFEKVFASANVKGEVKREAGKYIYQFTLHLEPGQSASVKVSINYAWLIIPLLVVLVIIVLILALSHETVVFKKSIKRVKTKTGIFALRVYLTVKNKTRQELKDVAILDYVPLSLKYHEYGLTIPDKIEENKLYWNLESLLPGEEKTVSYICVSKIKYEGGMTLPPAKLKYVDQKNRKVILSSNSPKISVAEEEE